VFEAKFMLPWSFSEEAAAESDSRGAYNVRRRRLLHRIPIFSRVTLSWSCVLTSRMRSIDSKIFSHSCFLPVSG